MTLVIGYHEIDDSAESPNRAAVLADVRDMAAFQAVMQSESGADAMAYEGVRADTFVLLIEA